MNDSEKGSKRHWCFTNFILEGWNPQDFDYKDKIKYLIYQLEKCPTTGRIHAQGYVELKVKVGKKLCQEILRTRCRVEARKGDRDQARDYCLKSETKIEGPWEYGEWDVTQGTRNDIREMVELIKNGANDIELIEKTPVQFVKYFKAADRIRSVLDKQRTKSFRHVQTYIFWGESRSGKTRKVFELTNYEVYRVNWKNKWFDGYEGEDAILFDDFDGNFEYRELLQILDGYPIQREIKGSHCWAKWTKVYFTSNIDPNRWYDKSKGDIHIMPIELKNRITLIERMMKEPEDITDVE